MKIRRAGVSVTDILLSVAAVFYLFPIYILIVNSFKTMQDIIQNPYLLPTRIVFDNFRSILTEGRLLEAIKNNIVITLCVVVALVVFSSMSGYALSRFLSRTNSFIYLYFIAGILIPFQSYMIPLIKELQIFGLLRNPVGLWLVFMAQFTPLSIFLYSGFVKSVPIEMEEAGRIDGCGPYSLFARIVFPMLKPCTASVVIVFSINVWNAFVVPTIIMGTVRYRLLYVEVFKYIQDKFFHQWNMTFAASLLSIMPIVLLYVFMQNRIIGGLTGGAVKG